MTERHIDGDIRKLKELLLGMAGHVERAIDHATGALLSGDSRRFPQVFESEAKVNDAHIAVDEGCVSLLALQQPMAEDLRLIISILKINADLERMGDQAVNIAQSGERYLASTRLSNSTDLEWMSTEVRSMVREALDAFVKRDEAKAWKVLKRDDEVDALKRKILNESVAQMKTDAGKIDGGVTLILIARALERIGDHATNIAEDVIYTITGKDIRHPGSQARAAAAARA